MLSTREQNAPLTDHTAMVEATHVAMWPLVASTSAAVTAPPCGGSLRTNLSVAVVDKKLRLYIIVVSGERRERTYQPNRLNAVNN
jgi:hypothetical protein